MPKNNKNNRKYTNEEKEKMKKILLNTDDVKRVSSEYNIPESTLRQWKIKAMKNVVPSNDIKIINAPITSRDKFQVVVETYSYSEYELAEYCRKNGIYKDEIKKWRKSFESTLDKDSKEIKEIKQELSEEKNKKIQLEKELKRKEKALAEAAALLVLQKKFQAFMEEEED